MADVERVRASIALEVARIGTAGLGLYRQLRQQRRRVETLAERVLHVEGETAREAL